MPSADPLQHDQNNLRHYKQLGLQPGAPMHDIETAYWRIARELKGQAAMAPYNDAYEALVNRNRLPIGKPELAEPIPVPAAKQKEAGAVRPPSKFGWPT